jgi:hypothetical protein
MNVRQFVRSNKVITQAGNWRCAVNNPKEKMGKESFPLAKGRSFVLGNQWYWKLDQWSSVAHNGRLLIAYNLVKGNYLAYISVQTVSKEYAIIVCLEYHGDHDGWHVHSGSGAVKDFAVGCTRQRFFGIRKPSKGAYSRPRKLHGVIIDGLGMSQITAQNIAYKAFRVVNDIEHEGLFG